MDVGSSGSLDRASLVSFFVPNRKTIPSETLFIIVRCRLSNFQISNTTSAHALKTDVLTILQVFFVVVAILLTFSGNVFCLALKEHYRITCQIIRCRLNTIR